MVVNAADGGNPERLRTSNRELIFGRIIEIEADVRMGIEKINRQRIESLYPENAPEEIPMIFEAAGR